MIISNFILKILALVFMTIDHIGLMINNDIMRYIGKAALPIFLYMIFEGCRHTSNIKKYMYKLLIMGGLMYICTAVAQILLFNKGMYFQNIFLTLLALVFSYYILFKNDNKKLKILIILPIIYFILSYAYEASMNNNFRNLYYTVILDGLTGMYSLQASLIFFFMCLFNWVYEKTVKKRIGEDLGNSYLTTKQAQLSRNALMSLSVIIISAICYGLTYVSMSNFSFGPTMVYNTYLVLSIPFILMYNGKRGFNNKYVNGAFYLYYPLHIGIIALIFFLITGGI